MFHAHLFVGFGGSGGKTLVELGRLISQDPSWSRRATRQCFFLLVDTDAKMIDESMDLMKQALSDRTTPPVIKPFRLSQDVSSYARTIGGDLFDLQWSEEDWKNMRRSWWFNESGQPFVAANAGNAASGASQCPPLSYYLAWRSMQRFEATIESIYRDMQAYALESSDKLHVTVSLIGSLAGGTGRGCWAPLSLKISEIVKRNETSCSKPCGYFFDASVFNDVMNKSADQARQMRVNSITGVSEISAWLQNNAQGDKRSEFWLPTLRAPSDRTQAMLDLSRCYTFKDEQTATPVQEAWIVFADGPSGSMPSAQAAYEMTAVGLYARLVQSQIQSDDNNVVRRHMAGLATAIYTVDTSSVEQYLRLHLRSRIPSLIAKSLPEDEVRTRLEDCLNRAVRLPRSDDMMKAISEPLAKVCHSSFAFTQFMASMPDLDKNPDSDQNKDEAIERAKNFDGPGSKMSEEQAEQFAKDLLKRLCGGRSITEPVRESILNKSLSLRGASQVADALSKTLRASAKSLSSDWVKEVGKGSKPSSTASLRQATEERSDLDSSRWKVWKKKVFFTSDQIDELRTIATEIFFRNNAPIVCKKIASLLEAAASTAESIAKRLTQALDRMDTRAGQELTDARKIAKKCFVSPHRRYKPRGVEHLRITRRALPAVVDEESLERELDSALDDIRAQPESFRECREQVLEHVWNYAMQAESGSVSQFDTRLQQLLAELSTLARMPMSFLTKHFALNPTAEALAKVIVHQMNESDERTRNVLSNEFEVLFGTKPRRKDNKFIAPESDELIKRMAVSLAKTCDPFVLFHRDTGETKDRVMVFLPQGYDEEFAKDVQKVSEMPLLTVKASDRADEEDTDLSHQAGASPFSMVAYADQTIELEPIGRSPNHLSGIRNLDYRDRPEVSEWLRLTEDPSGTSLFDRRPGTCGFGFTWPGFVNDAAWAKLRWRPWQPATLGGEKHVRALLWALAGEPADLRKREARTAIEALSKIRSAHPEWSMPLLTVQRQGQGFAWVFSRKAASARKSESGTKIFFDGSAFGPGSEAHTFSSVKKLVDFLGKNPSVVKAIQDERSLFDKTLAELDDELGHEQMLARVHRGLMQGVEEFLIREHNRTKSLGTTDTLLPIVESLREACMHAQHA